MRLPRAAWPLVVLAAFAPPLAAQVFTRPELHWETLETAHFELHFPRSMQAWALDAASRLEAVQGPIVRLVGNAPSRRVTVVIDDPYNVSNGAALPILTWPTIVLWPTPPGPSDDLGTAPDWAALLAAHEFAHIAQLTWPSRNATDRTLWRVLPVELGPVARRAPRWVMEAYAVYVEGLLEGGRPHSAARAAILRQWAIEGRLPSYGELDGSPRFLGGDMEYLLGSAFLEWLVARYGEASLPNVWRRLSARVTRDFNTAFIGVYGDSPGALYGRFTAELTGKALRAADLITSAGLDSGETFQRLTWYTGDPAVSAEGRRLAVPVRIPGEPTRIVVWSTAPAPIDTARIHARRDLLKRDSGDVPAVHPFPTPRTPMATLDGSRGSGYDMPRFFADTVHLLVSHPEPRPDGAIRPELFEWNMRSGNVRRITHGAAVRDADPAPDGLTAIGVRCLDGTCDLVRVQLSNGRVGVLLKGSPTLAYNHPRFAPNGRSAVVAVRDTAGWHDQEIDLNDTGVVATRRIGPDNGANRYGPAYIANGSAIVTVSDWGGIRASGDDRQSLWRGEDLGCDDRRHQCTRRLAGRLDSLLPDGVRPRPRSASRLTPRCPRHHPADVTSLAGSGCSARSDTCTRPGQPASGAGSDSLWPRTATISLFARWRLRSGRLVFHPRHLEQRSRRSTRLDTARRYRRPWDLAGWRDRRRVARATGHARGQCVWRVGLSLTPEMPEPLLRRRWTRRSSAACSPPVWSDMAVSERVQRDSESQCRISTSRLRRGRVGWHSLVTREWPTSVMEC